MKKIYEIYTIDEQHILWSGNPPIKCRIIEGYDDYKECMGHFHEFERLRKKILRYPKKAALAGAPADVVASLEFEPVLQFPLVENARLVLKAQEMIFPVPEKPHRKAVLCLTTAALFPSQLAAAEATGVAASAINAHLNKRRGYRTVRGMEFIVLNNYRGPFDEKNHREAVKEWERQRDDPHRGKRLVTAQEALEYREKRRAEKTPAPQAWTPSEDD